MQLFVKIDKNKYIDSLETLFITSVITAVDGVDKAYVAMATKTAKDTLRQMELLNDDIMEAKDGDLVIAMLVESEEVFKRAIEKVGKSSSAKSTGSDSDIAYPDITSAVKANPNANICSIAVPGEHALDEVKKAMNNGLHCIVFSNNVPPEDEKEMKELAREKGLLCMGPDCGVANINGLAFVLGSINNRGPFGVCAASGTGLQHVAAMLHEAGSGITQGIGTGGFDLKDPIDGISMLMGIDALENDAETKYIILISRKPADNILKKLLDRIKKCEKPVVALFMGADKQEVEASGAIWAQNLDDCGQKALELVGLKLDLAGEKEISEIAKQAIEGMSNEQKYVRGAFVGGTYCDEAMRAMQDKIGGINSNCPLSPELELEDSYKSVGNTVVDYGEEEFTLGRPHPVIDPSIRELAIMREAEDKQTAVILLDFVLTPPGHVDPAGYAVKDILKAQKMAEARGGKIAFVASVLGTDADIQDIRKQEEKLKQAGVYVCQTNFRAGMLAGEIIKQKMGVIK